MEEKEVKLEVNNLKISFRTDAGKVQAVRDISFKLYKGETLAIVGESGSGKSVTNRAVMGILAGNAIKEGGEIVYDGQDLMKISEEDFHRIRGDKIAMIFQDPLSSLNPIMRIGKQMTEAMLIKGRVSQKNSRRDFNTTLKLLKEAMDGAFPNEEEKNKQLCSDFDRFEFKHIALEQAYNRATEAAEDAASAIEDILFRIEKEAYKDVVRDARSAVSRAKDSFDRYVVYDRAEELKGLLKEAAALLKSSIPKRIGEFFASFRGREKEEQADFAALSVTLASIRSILTEALAFPMPNFFAMGYYLTFSQEPLPALGVEEMNTYLHDYLSEKFMSAFIDRAAEALRYSHEAACERKRAAIAKIEELRPVFEAETLEKNACYAAVKALSAAVTDGIDRLEIVKDNLAYTFPTSLEAAVKLYFDGVVRNKKEQDRYASQSKRYEALVAAGKTPSYSVAEMDLVDLKGAREGILGLLVRVTENFSAKIAKKDDYHAKADALIDYLKEKASGVVFKVTKSMAKLRALKLMDEVGIAEPRKRFYQYPFELSGGMRQRIVIAIALAANPDILICDEPTTALDVTIQSQILELINRIKMQRNLSVIFITHNLGVVANMADRVAVMYAGKIVEIGTAEDIFYSPAHPYTWALLSSMPDLDTKEKLEAIPGTPPNMIYPPKGDAFAERNKYALKIDFEMQPPMFRISETHSAATWLLHPDAPKVDPPKAVVDRIARMKERGGIHD